jgi:hypothetical protein
MLWSAVTLAIVLEMEKKNNRQRRRDEKKKTNVQGLDDFGLQVLSEQKWKDDVIHCTKVDK